MDQAVMVFDDATERDVALGTAVVSEGMVSYLGDTDALSFYDGSSWRTLGSVSGLPVVAGGTGGTTVAEAQDNLGVGLVPISPSTVGVAGPGSSASANSLGLVTFANATSFNLNGVFSSGFRSYRIVYRVTVSQTTDINMRMRLSGTDNTSGYFTSGWNYTSGSTGSGYSGANIGFMVFGNGIIGWSVCGQLDLHNPFLTEITKGTFNSSGHNGGQPTGYFGGLAHNNATSYDGFTIYPNTGGVLNGTIQVYGYNA
jgi:hypothetical protein